MILTGLALQNFRLHSTKIFKFTKPTTLIVGPNAVGKTSVAEAIMLLATGRSFRANRVEEMIKFDEDLARVKGVVVDQDQKKIELETILTKGLVNGRRTQRTLFRVNDVKRRKKDAINHFYTVLFRPEDMRLIEGSPARRRSYLDSVLVTIYPEYAVALKNYEQTLKRRNKLLWQVREGEQTRTVLQYWNLALVKHGVTLQDIRSRFLASFSQVEFPLSFEVEYQASVISTERQQEYLAREIASGYSLIGPHKDDLVVYLMHQGKRLRLDSFGSRGQQRLGVLWLKFCELDYLKTVVNERIEDKLLLVLDDILSELDETSRQLALTVALNYQTIITTTDLRVLKELEQVVEVVDIIKL